MVTRYKSRKGFTLVEILIVVIILGILAAIVIPQFTSASQDARRSSLASTVQSVRSQIELYKLQHGDELPDLLTDWKRFTEKTDAAHNLSPAATVQSYGPYMQSEPSNGLMDSGAVSPFTDMDTVPTTGFGFVYDYNAGKGTGRFWGIDKYVDPADSSTKYKLLGDN
jgi:general secretion pathway protein G